MSTCLTCGGEGIIITCCDDICVGGGHCIHGDGEEMCPDCDGEGVINDDDDDWWYPDDDDREPVSFAYFYNTRGDHFNIEAVCPDYLPESQCSFTWYRDKDGVAIVTGYGPDEDTRNWWLCICGNLETSGMHCSCCGSEPPWGCDCGEHGEDYDEDMDFGDLEPEFEPDFDED